MQRECVGDRVDVRDANGREFLVKPIVSPVILRCDRAAKPDVWRIVVLADLKDSRVLAGLFLAFEHGIERCPSAEQILEIKTGVPIRDDGKQLRMAKTDPEGRFASDKCDWWIEFASEFDDRVLWGLRFVERGADSIQPPGLSARGGVNREAS